MKTLRHGLLSLAILMMGCAAKAQISITTSGSPYTENFNGYAGSLGTVPSGWAISFSATPTFLGTGTGTGSTGGTIAYGSSGDFSLGALRTATPGNITFDVSFTNNTGSTISALTLSWDYEQYRYVNSSGFTASGTGSLTGSSVLATRGFTGSATGTHGTPTTTPSGSITLTGLSISPSSIFGVKWVTTDASGSDNGVAIDNLSLTATAIPEPSTYAAILGLVGLIGVMIRRRLQHAA